MKILKVIIIVGLCVTLVPPMAGVADAATYYFVPPGADINWNTSGNWQVGNSCSDITGGGAVPSSADHAVICQDKVVEVTNTSAAAKTVTVQGGTARLDIKPGTGSGQHATLSLGSGSDPLTSKLYGGGERIKLLNDNTAQYTNKATLAFVSANHTLDQEAGTGTATIRGEDDDAQITIASDKKLTTKIGFIKGRLQILSPSSGTGELFVDGSYMEADSAGGTFLIAPYKLDDREGVSWDATGGTLEFGPAIQVITDVDGWLKGEFLARLNSTAKIVVNDGTSTTLIVTGPLEINSGAILHVKQSLTMGSAGGGVVGANLAGGSILVDGGKTFIHH